MYFIILAKGVIARIICKIPAIAIIARMDVMFAFRACMIDAITIVTGPVIPDIKGDFPPNRAAVRQRIIVPHNPARAPKPVATPNARACGRAIIAELSPPNISPKKCFSLTIS